MTGDDGPDGVKAFYIHIEARPDKVAEVRRMLADILGHVEGEPATGPRPEGRRVAEQAGLHRLAPRQGQQRARARFPGLLDAVLANADPAG
jgi:hypothetical protein